MATVTLYQQTDMSALPISPRMEGHWNNFEMDFSEPGNFGPALSYSAASSSTPTDSL